MARNATLLFSVCLALGCLSLGQGEAPAQEGQQAKPEEDCRSCHQRQHDVWQAGAHRDVFFLLSHLFLGWQFRLLVIQFLDAVVCRTQSLLHIL